MEGLSYFDAFYACFITYMTIGFGDMDIFVSKTNSNIKIFSLQAKELITNSKEIKCFVLAYNIALMSSISFSPCRIGQVG